MRYFFLIYAIIAVLVVGIGGFRGQHFSKPPVMVFPDMDNQDKLKAQAPSTFFGDRKGGRLPVDETQPLGFNEEGASEMGGIPEPEFGGLEDYYHTGHVGDYYGTGMPEELGLNDETIVEFIAKGEERYGIYCAVCHGAAGDGLGITSRYGVPGIANFHSGPFSSATYPDGRMFEVVTHGKGMMSGYGANVPVRDRWAIIAYVRTLQAAKEMAAAAPQPQEEPAEEAGTEEIAPAVQEEPAVPPATEDTPPTTPGAPAPGESLPNPSPQPESDQSAPTQAEEAAQ